MYHTAASIIIVVRTRHGLGHEIELVRELRLQFAKDGVVVERQTGTVAKGLGQRLQVGNVAQQLGLDRRPLHLDGDLLAAVLFRQHGAVHLRDAGGAQRRVVEFHKDVFEVFVGVQQFAGNDRPGEGAGHGVDIVGEITQGFRVLGGEQILPTADDLGRLDVPMNSANENQDVTVRDNGPVAPRGST